MTYENSTFTEIFGSSTAGASVIASVVEVIAKSNLIQGLYGEGG